jgi:hypothetical protein
MKADIYLGIIAQRFNWESSFAAFCFKLRRFYFWTDGGQTSKVSLVGKLKESDYATVCLCRQSLLDLLLPIGPNRWPLSIGPESKIRVYRPTQLGEQNGQEVVCR